MLAEPRELDEILRTVVGSGVHGIAIPGTDDHDEMGVFIEPPSSVVGLGVEMDSDLWRTQPEGHRSGHGDIDLMRYSLRKFVRLAVHGNPSILVPLFAPKDYTVIETKLGSELRDLAPAIVSKQAGQRFLGYMQSQLERLQGGGRQSRLPKRPELIEKYGYDVKYASHALRLAIQGVELLETGRLELPMRSDYRALVRQVKTGEFTQPEAVTMIKYWEAKLKALLNGDGGVLAASPDVERISRWMEHAHARHWRTHLEWRT